jgi:hypothetical protein
MASPLAAQSVTLPAEIKGARGAWIVVAPKLDGGAPKWRVDPRLQEVDLAALLPADSVAKLKGKVFTSATDGRFKVEVWCAKADGVSDIATTWLIVGDGKPVTPDGVKPAPAAPAPILEPGFRVLIVDEVMNRGSLPFSQRIIFTSVPLRKFLEANCVVDPKTKTPEFRFYDQNVDMKNELPRWQNAMKRPRSSLPWLLVSTGTTGYEGPLPKTVDETIALLKKIQEGGTIPVDPVTPSDIAARITWWEQNYPQYASKP